MNAPTPSPKLVLVRHGETEWAISGRHTSFTDLDLSDRGRTEAMGLAPFLGSLEFQHVLVSPLKRARQTCELAGLHVDPEVDVDLREWEYGDYEGRTSTDIQRERKAWNLFQDGCPNGESPRQVSDRADRVIRRLQTRMGNGAIFTHGQFGAVLGARWITLHVVEARHFPLSTASVSVLGFDAHHRDTPVIELWNSRSPIGADTLKASDNGTGYTGRSAHPVDSQSANDPSLFGSNPHGS